MKQTTRHVVFAFSAVLMIALALMTLFAMIVAPPCTGVMQKANFYKIVSLCVSLGSYYVLAWRRGSVFAAMLLPASQIISGLLFINYLNSFPLGCAE